MIDSEAGVLLKILSFFKNFLGDSVRVEKQLKKKGSLWREPFVERPSTPDESLSLTWSVLRSPSVRGKKRAVGFIEGIIPTF